MSKGLSFIIFIAGLAATAMMYPPGRIGEDPNYHFRMFMSILLFVVTIAITVYYGKKRDEDNEDEQ